MRLKWAKCIRKKVHDNGTLNSVSIIVQLVLALSVQAMTELHMESFDLFEIFKKLTHLATIFVRVQKAFASYR